MITSGYVFYNHCIRAAYDMQDRDLKHDEYQCKNKGMSMTCRNGIIIVYKKAIIDDRLYFAL